MKRSRTEVITIYALMHAALTKPFYARKRKGLVTAQEQAEFDMQHSGIWNDFESEWTLEQEKEE